VINPNAIELHEYDQDNYVIDMPGFNDTEKVMEISNQFATNLVIKNVSEAKFALVIAEASLSHDAGKGKIFKETLENFANMFTDEIFDKLKDSICLIINKVRYKEPIGFVEQELKNILDANDLSDKAKHILEYTMRPSETEKDE